MSTVVPITRYRSKDNKEFDRRADAEEHDAYLLAEGMIYRAVGPRYSPGYDGPMPVGPPMSAEDMFRHRALLRNIFLDLPEPPAQVIVKTEYENVYRWPLMMMSICLALGVFVGWYWL